ncbi:hypothetical protein [uncultured Clostridium sp.]|nr:hypothetical protein [uncultured Clostridium sp.]
MGIIELLIYTFIFLFFLMSLTIYLVCTTTYKIKLELLKCEYENYKKK